MSDLQEQRNFVYNILCSEKPLDEQIALYSEIAETYDQMCDDTLYHYPEILSQELETFNLCRDSKILDVGAGTGRLGKLLHSLKYTNIDALDGCEKMLQQARNLPDVYRSFTQALVIADNELPIPEKKYDVALMCGSGGPAHIDVTAYKQLIRVVKSGGLIGWIIDDPEIRVKISSRFHDNFYEKTLQKFVNEQLWVAVDGYNPKRVPNAAVANPGDVFFYKVL
ncbi:malonyl-[acyl-carrier protein] O-methyltransferase-like protein [Leptotrombidium deliense]|uniref:Malonyl-[acyl-carrier protein] O-methyltransferase-like protein n=1 Tax=Leptotrombidium deliense TaxID=299467 RepID=A0A443S5A4_9ACAR|nr:malonyl-[acyl-carrier protein] O-methyltransferase-like protein [Leptotrombidium deliense]